jgi:hypothetical protein
MVLWQRKRHIADERQSDDLLLYLIHLMFVGGNKRIVKTGNPVAQT